MLRMAANCGHFRLVLRATIPGENWRPTMPRTGGRPARRLAGDHPEEIAGTLTARITKGTRLVFDKWVSTEDTVKKLGYVHAPGVNHSEHWRDPAIGFHTNDVESENNRMKHWARVRYGKLLVEELDMHEYMIYVNTGSSMHTVLKAFV